MLQWLCVPLSIFFSLIFSFSLKPKICVNFHPTLPNPFVDSDETCIQLGFSKIHTQNQSSLQWCSHCATSRLPMRSWVLWLQLAAPALAHPEEIPASHPCPLHCYPLDVAPLSWSCPLGIFYMLVITMNIRKIRELRGNKW